MLASYRSAIASFGVVALSLWAGAAASAPLDKEACNALKVEQSQLEAAGARANMLKGPAWAQANLPPLKVQEIARLIEVDEGLAFRCGLARAPVAKEVLAKADAAETTEQLPGAEQEAKPAPPPAKPKRREAARKAEPAGAQPAPAAAPPAPAKKTAPVTKAAPDGQPAAATSEPPPAPQNAPQKKAARKQKTDDAFKPSGPPASTLDDQVRSLVDPTR